MIGNRAQRLHRTALRMHIADALTDDRYVDVAVEQIVDGARKCAAGADRPLVYVLDWLSTGSGIGPGGALALQQRDWAADGAQLPFELTSLSFVIGMDAFAQLTHRGLVPRLQAEFNAAGLRGVTHKQARAMLVEHIGEHIAAQHTRARAALTVDVDTRVGKLLAGTTTVALMGTDTDTVYSVVAVGTDRIVFADGHLAAGENRTVSWLADLARLTPTVSAEFVTLAGRKVTGSADSDGSVTIRVDGRTVVLPPRDADRVLAAITAATTVTVR